MNYQDENRKYFKQLQKTYKDVIRKGGLSPKEFYRDMVESDGVDLYPPEVWVPAYEDYVAKAG